MSKFFIKVSETHEALYAVDTGTKVEAEFALTEHLYGREVEADIETVNKPRVVLRKLATPIQAVTDREA